MTRIVKGIDKMNKVLSIIIGLILIIMSIIIFYQVFSRFVIGNSLQWSEELARYLMVWGVFLGAALALRKHELIAVEGLSEILPAKVNRFLKYFVYVMCIVFSLLLITQGFKMVEGVISQTSPAMQISMAWAYSAIPIGGVFILINSIAVIVEYISFGREGTK